MDPRDRVADLGRREDGRLANEELAEMNRR
jgi:hypothetical protein